MDVIIMRVDEMTMQGAAAACRRAGLTCFHPDGLRAAAANESALQGTDRTMTSMQTCAALPAMSG